MADVEAGPVRSTCTVVGLVSVKRPVAVPPPARVKFRFKKSCWPSFPETVELTPVTPAAPNAVEEEERTTVLFVLLRNWKEN